MNKQHDCLPIFYVGSICARNNKSSYTLCYALSIVDRVFKLINDQFVTLKKHLPLGNTLYPQSRLTLKFDLKD